MYDKLKPQLQATLQEIKDAGLYKNERIITSPQGADIITSDGKEVTNFCANNYLGLSSHPKVTEAAKKAIDTPWVWNVVCEVYLWYTGYS